MCECTALEHWRQTIYGQQNLSPEEYGKHLTKGLQTSKWNNNVGIVIKKRWEKKSNALMRLQCYRETWKKWTSQHKMWYIPNFLNTQLSFVTTFMFFNIF